MEYMICWEENKNYETEDVGFIGVTNTSRRWCIVQGEDSMQECVGDLMDKLKCEADDICVFEMESQI